MPEPTPLGKLLEKARAELRISAREAARRAGISESHWRQMIAGHQWRSGREVPISPKPRTVIAMALAVAADPAGALAAAGLAEPANLPALIEDVRREARGQASATGPVLDLTGDEHRRLTAEIARIEGLRLPESAKLTMLEALIRAWERYAVERDAGSAAS